MSILLGANRKKKAATAPKSSNVFNQQINKCSAQKPSKVVPQQRKSVPTTKENECVIPYSDVRTNVWHWQLGGRWTTIVYVKKSGEVWCDGKPLCTAEECSENESEIETKTFPSTNQNNHIIKPAKKNRNNIDKNEEKQKVDIVMENPPALLFDIFVPEISKNYRCKLISVPPIAGPGTTAEKKKNPVNPLDKHNKNDASNINLKENSLITMSSIEDGNLPNRRFKSCSIEDENASAERISSRATGILIDCRSNNSNLSRGLKTEIDSDPGFSRLRNYTIDSSNYRNDDDGLADYNYEDYEGGTVCSNLAAPRVEYALLVEGAFIEERVRK